MGNCKDLIYNRIGRGNAAISIAKALGIILVVVGHSGAPGPITKFIYSFHMPLFFILSGYFTKEIFTLKDLFSFVEKKMKTLWLPYVLFCIPFVALHNVFLSMGLAEGGLYSLLDFVKQFALLLVFKGQPAGFFPAFWFLRALFISTITMAVISLVKNSLKIEKYDYLIPLVIASLLQLSLTVLKDNLIVNLTLYSVLYLYVGKIHRQFIEEPLNINKGLILCVTLIITIISSQSQLMCQITEVSSVSFITYALFAYVGSIFIMTCGKIISEYKGIVPTALTYIGNHTMIILALHAVVFKLLNCLFVPIMHLPKERLLSLQLSSYMFGGWLIYSIVGITIPLMIYWSYESLKLKIIKK